MPHRSITQMDLVNEMRRRLKRDLAGEILSTRFCRDAMCMFICIIFSRVFAQNLLRATHRTLLIFVICVESHFLCLPEIYFNFRPRILKTTAFMLSVESTPEKMLAKECWDAMQRFLLIYSSAGQDNCCVFLLQHCDAKLSLDSHNVNFQCVQYISKRCYFIAIFWIRLHVLNRRLLNCNALFMHYTNYT